MILNLRGQVAPSRNNGSRERPHTKRRNWQRSSGVIADSTAQKCFCGDGDTQTRAPPLARVMHAPNVIIYLYVCVAQRLTMVSSVSE